MNLIAEFLPCTSKDIDEMFSELMHYIGAIEDSFTRSLLLSLFSDHDGRVVSKHSPASVSYHCGWIGGLLGHPQCGEHLRQNFSNISRSDRDLLLAGAILHDLGKVRCYDARVPSQSRWTVGCWVIWSLAQA